MTVQWRTIRPTSSQILFNYILAQKQAEQGSMPIITLMLVNKKMKTCLVISHNVVKYLNLVSGGFLLLSYKGTYLFKRLSFWLKSKFSCPDVTPEKELTRAPLHVPAMAGILTGTKHVRGSRGPPDAWVINGPAIVSALF